jgi:hypothetical protein
MKEKKQSRWPVWAFMGVLLLAGSMTASAQFTNNGDSYTWSYTVTQANGDDYADAFVWAYEGKYLAELEAAGYCTPGEPVTLENCGDTAIKRANFVDVQLKDYARDVYLAHQKYLDEQAYVEPTPPTLD